ncbi:MAG: siderophore-interacting protein, partial [Mycobacteriaceae bacterium]
MIVQTAEITAYRPFRVEVAGLRRLGPSFLRVTFTGTDLDRLASNGRDQRIKVVFPVCGIGLRQCPSGPDWYAAWRALPTERRNPVRTYTVRVARPERREVDVDFVL